MATLKSTRVQDIDGIANEIAYDSTNVMEWNPIYNSTLTNQLIEKDKFLIGQMLHDTYRIDTSVKMSTNI